MGKFWNKVGNFVCDFVDDNPGLGAAAFFFLLLLFIGFTVGFCLLNVSFWSYQTPTTECPSPSFWGCAGESHLNLHGQGWFDHLFFSIALIEMCFILFCMLIKRGKKESSWYYALKNKLYALGIWAIVYFVLFPLIWLVSITPYLSVLVCVGKFFIVIGTVFLIIWKPALCVVGVIAAVGLYYLINVGLSKIFEKEK